jgi:hypothetical protein
VARALVISGSLGAGKTRISWEVRDVLAERGRRVAEIELDALCQLEPAPPDDPYNDRLGFANLAAIWPNYEAAGVQDVVIARVVEHPGDRERFARALGGASVAIVRLEASSETRRSRLAAREPEGHWRDGHLARTDELAAILATAALDDLVVDNDARPARQVAKELLAGIGW